MRIPLALRGESAASTLKMCAAPKPARTGEQSIGTLCPRKQTSETVCDTVLSECESTLPSNPRTQTSPRGEFAPGSVSALSSWTDVCKALCWWVWDLELAPHPSWVPRNSGCKNRSPARLVGLALLLLSRADSLSLVSEPGHFEAMLETAPRHWNGVVCVWIEEYIPALSCWVANARFPE